MLIDSIDCKSASNNSNETEELDVEPAEESSFAMFPEAEERRLEEGEVDDY